MLAFDMLTTAFTRSLIHALAANYLNARNVRKSYRLNLKFFSMAFLICFWSCAFLHEPYVYYPINLFLLPLWMSYVYKLGITETFALSTISDLIIFFGELSGQAFIDAFSGNILYRTAVKNAVSLFITAVVISAASLIKKRQLSKKLTKVSIYYVLFFAAVNAAFNVLLFLSGTGTYNIYLKNFGYKLFIATFLIYVLSLRGKARFEQRCRDYIRLNRYTRLIENMYDDLAGQKHNFSNILFSINGYLLDNRFSELSEYLNNHVLKDYCRNLSHSFLGPLKYIQNPALKGIVFSKLNEAATKNIKLFINIFNEIEINNIDPSDLVKIIGILLDNAIEACEKSPDNELHLGMDSDNTHTSILIGNTYYQLPDLNMICERGYSTKGKDRGFGMYNLKKILSLYPHAHLKTTINGNLFFQELIIMK
ncbi:GHKL domain-containing protein [Thermoclostridium stercorarium]|uniref:sensor histidine kinase n=1 Tax=Thermoclostridium stercorarium TaxID=1510 RepID=UPI0022490694|nr:GHKL domain-containing protein [Thermoclostridium stercorarium]UZQ86128.1 GHKL domain-containing protein [Thermoclostridium stercorarium]